MPNEEGCDRCGWVVSKCRCPKPIRFAGDATGRGHGPGGRLEPQRDDVIELRLSDPVRWTPRIVQGYDFWRGRFDLDRDSGDCTVWRWPHKKALGITGYCCPDCLSSATDERKLATAFHAAVEAHSRAVEARAVAIEAEVAARRRCDDALAAWQLSRK